MTRRHILALTAAVLGAVTVCAVGAALVLVHRPQSEQSTGAVMTVATHPIAQPVRSPLGNRPLLTAIRKFALGYGSYLNGGAASALAKAGSVTAFAQAKQEGRIPAAFRDGNIRVAQVDALESTCCSASTTVVLANREERYPFAEQLLLERHGWVVDQITPADLSMDRNLRPAPRLTMPAGGTAAAKAFAVAYVNFRSGESGARPAMGAAADREVAAGTDSLAEQALPKAPARLVSIKFGPPSAGEFAATATVRDGRAQLTFTFLMVKTKAGWQCGQYL